VFSPPLIPFRSSLQLQQKVRPFLWTWYGPLFFPLYRFSFLERLRIRLAPGFSPPDSFHRPEEVSYRLPFFVVS